MANISGCPRIPADLRVVTRPPTGRLSPYIRCTSGWVLGAGVSDEDHRNLLRECECGRSSPRGARRRPNGSRLASSSGTSVLRDYQDSSQIHRSTAIRVGVVIVSCRSPATTVRSAFSSRSTARARGTGPAAERVPGLSHWRPRGYTRHALLEPLRHLPVRLQTRQHR